MTEIEADELMLKTICRFYKHTEAGEVLKMLESESRAWICHYLVTFTAKYFLINLLVNKESIIFLFWQIFLYIVIHDT